MSDIHCPACGSSNIQKLSLAVLNGTEAFAALHAPPAKKGTGLASFCLVFSVIISLIFQSPFFLVVSLFAFGFLLQAVFYNERDYPPLLEAWQKQWVCQRCAEVFKTTD